MKTWKRLSLIAAAALLLTGCATSDPVEEIPELIEPVGVQIDTAQVIRSDFYTSQCYEGSVKASTHELSFEIDGVLDEISIYPGCEVTEGEVLMTLDQDSLEERIADIRSQIDYTETCGSYDDSIAEINIQLLELDMEELIAGGRSRWRRDLKQLEIDRARLQLEEAQALRELTLDNLNAQLDACLEIYGHNTITAPCSGHAYYDPNFTNGSSVQAEKVIVYVTDPDDTYLEISSYLSEAELNSCRFYALIGDQRYDLERIPMDQKEMTTILLSGEKLPTRFLIKTGAGTPSAGDYAVVVLEKGYTENVLQIPVGALHSASGVRYVYVMDGSDRQRRDVEVGTQNGVMVQILSGLEEGETVYVKD